MAKRLSVVISQNQSPNPAKRKLEEDLVIELMMISGVDVVIVPHLYDIAPESTGHLALKSTGGDLVVVAWLFERASRWVLDRMGVRGQAGVALLGDDDEEEEDDDDQAMDSDSATEDVSSAKQHVADMRPIPNRFIYCLDFRARNQAQDFVDEIKRIQAACQVSVSQPKGLGALPIVQPPASAVSSAQSAAPTNGVHPPRDGDLENGKGPTGPFVVGENGVVSVAPATLNRIQDDATRRWYPVIDYSRCTNCMECIDFCLFGVYGVDPMETILVEQPDNCRKGCPACSRVCPENAIMFPQHKTPAIAGANEAVTSLKIDLSQLFGAPAEEKSAIEVAAAERDEQLLMAGRDAVGLSVGIPKRQDNRENGPRDVLDDLIDQLDDFDR